MACAGCARGAGAHGGPLARIGSACAPPRAARERSHAARAAHAFPHALAVRRARNRALVRAADCVARARCSHRDHLKPVRQRAPPAARAARASLAHRARAPLSWRPRRGSRSLRVRARAPPPRRARLSAPRARASSVERALRMCLSREPSVAIESATPPLRSLPPLPLRPPLALRLGRPGCSTLSMPQGRRTGLSSERTNHGASTRGTHSGHPLRPRIQCTSGGRSCHTLGA